MNISQVRITLRYEEKLKCFANITFDDCFVVRGVKVIEGTNGRFVSMPSHKRVNGQYGDIAHPTNSEMRKRIEEAVFSAYAEKLEEAQNKPNDCEPIMGELTNPETYAWPQQRKRSG